MDAHSDSEIGAAHTVALLLQAFADVLARSGVRRQQSVPSLIVQGWALLSICGLCAAKRSCTMGKA